VLLIHQDGSLLIRSHFTLFLFPFIWARRAQTGDEPSPSDGLAHQASRTLPGYPPHVSCWCLDLCLSCGWHPEPGRAIPEGAVRTLLTIPAQGGARAGTARQDHTDSSYVPALGPWKYDVPSFWSSPSGAVASFGVTIRPGVFQSHGELSYMSAAPARQVASTCRGEPLLSRPYERPREGCYDWGARSKKQERAQLVRALRSSGSSWVEVAEALRQSYQLNPRVAFRYAHGWSQARAADEWNKRWPDGMKTFKDFSNWEPWPGRTGHAPTYDNLGKLVELYECSVSDLLVDLPNSVTWIRLTPLSLSSARNGRSCPMGGALDPGTGGSTPGWTETYGRQCHHFY
jgi:hypothetical protein